MGLFFRKESPAVAELHHKLPEVNKKALVEGLQFFQPPFNNEDLASALAILVFKLKERLNTYDTIISDDASARLVSLIVRKIVNKEREKAAKKSAETFFVASGRHSSEKVDAAIREFIRKELSRKGTLGKTLLVTEFIDSGHSIDKLASILEESGIDFDIAAVSVKRDPVKEPLDSIYGKLQNKIIYGDVSSIGASLHGRPEYAGVTKYKYGEYGDKISAFPRKALVEQARINLARKDAAILADRLYDWLEKQSP